MAIISAASARSHTRNQIATNSSSSGSFRKLSAALLVGLAAWTYNAIQPPPPKICGSPNGPPVTSNRIKLRDGRYLAYLEHGMPKEKAKYKIVYVHGFYSCRYDAIHISPELTEELGIYMVSFDRAGYGESDPDTKKAEKSTPLDIEELANQLGLGSKFYVIGYSMGGEIVWACLKYIPNRLAGAALLGPVGNFWWPGFPSNISKAMWDSQSKADKWAVWISHHLPFLTYWWNSQKHFPSSSAINFNPDIFSPSDLKVLRKFKGRGYTAQITQQGGHESLHRDMMVGFGRWSFGPLDIQDPFKDGEGSVHLWHGAEDRLVSVVMSRYIGGRLPWIKYHELPDAGHMFPLADGLADTIVRSLLIRD